MRLYHKPLVLLIWLGAVVMFLGGALSLSDRRLRIGAPKPAQAAQAGDAAGGVSVMRAQALASRSSLSRLRLPAHRRRSRCSPTKCLPTRRLKRAPATLSRELRCMVCQNQSIDDSDAPLARDLRLLVRERLKAGDSDTQVLDFLTARYGQFVLLKPRFGWDTALLWLAPAGVLLVGVWGLVALLRRSARQAAVGVADVGTARARRQRNADVWRSFSTMAEIHRQPS